MRIPVRLVRPLAGLFVVACSFSAWPQDAQQPPGQAGDADHKTELKQVTVTGSRIPRAQAEGPAPVTVIQGKDMDALGYRNAFDALTGLTQNTGSVQGEDFGSTFTPAASVISLRGLGPNHTLVLVDGRRIADYPVAYNGEVDAVNLANIPSVIIDRIEISSASASAIYGSDAIAGVINIILKKRMAGTDIGFRGGITQQGGGENERLQLATGQQWGALDAMFALELSNREPIRFGQRKLSDSYYEFAQPGTAPPALFSIQNAATGDYLNPPNNCQSLSGLLGGSVVAVTPPGGAGGTYCSSDHYYNNRTNQAGRKSINGYANLEYTLNDDLSLFGNFSYGYAYVDANVAGLDWSLPAGAFYNEYDGNLENWQRVLTPEETGGVDKGNNTYGETAWNAVAGIKGHFGADWQFEASYNRSANTSDQYTTAFYAGLDQFFLGPQTGTYTTTVDGTVFSYPEYNANLANLYTPLTPQQFNALSTRQKNHDTSYTQDLNFSINGTALQLPAGPLGVAAVLEAGNQNFRIRNDPRVNQGLFWNQGVAQDSGGDRNRIAAGIEAKVPLLAKLPGVSSLILDLAGRYDEYFISGGSSGKSTYNLGLEYRPVDNLLLRGTYATAFRAPDMNYLFEQDTTGYIPQQTDYYECRIANPPQPYSSCGLAYNMNFNSTGNRQLNPETATSFTYGMVWSPSSRYDVQADFYRTTIKNEVTNLSADLLLRQEADCLLGQTTNGTPVEASSPECVDALQRIQRNPSNAPANPNQVQNIHLNPVNAAYESTYGFDVSTNLRWTLGATGRYALKLAYTRVLSHTYEQFPGDPVLDYLNNVAYQTDWRNRLRGDLSWRLGPWAATVEGERFGSVPNEALTATRDIYMVFNTSASYTFQKRLTLSVIVNNVADSYPVDKSAGWPGYAVGWYDEYGRQFWLQADYHFGRLPGGG